jgi:hypothetical protein
MRSMASGAAFHRAYLRATQQAFLEAHEHAFAYFGGVFTMLRYDNLARAVRKILRGHRREETRFSTLRARHHAMAGRSMQRDDRRNGALVHSAGPGMVGCSPLSGCDRPMPHKHNADRHVFRQALRSTMVADGDAPVCVDRFCPRRIPARTRLIESLAGPHMSRRQTEKLCTDWKDEAGDNGVGGTLSATLAWGPYSVK